MGGGRQPQTTAEAPAHARGRRGQSGRPGTCPGPPARDACVTDTRGPRRSPAPRADWPRAAHSCATPLRRGLPRWAPHPLRLGGGPRVTSETGPSCPAPRGWGGHWCGPATGRARCGWAPAPAASGRGHRARPAAGRPGCCGGVEAGQRREAPVPAHVCRGSGCSEGAPRGRQQAHSWAEGPPPAWPCRALRPSPGLAAGLGRLPRLLVGVVQAGLPPGAVLDGGSVQACRLSSSRLQPLEALGRERRGLWGGFWPRGSLCRGGEA